MVTIILIVVVVLVLLYVMVTYNGLVRLRNRIQNAWAHETIQQSARIVPCRPVEGMATATAAHAR